MGSHLAVSFAISEFTNASMSNAFTTLFPPVKLTTMAAEATFDTLCRKLLLSAFIIIDVEDDVLRVHDRQDVIGEGDVNAMAPLPHA